MNATQATALTNMCLKALSFGIAIEYLKEASKRANPTRALETLVDFALLEAAGYNYLTEKGSSNQSCRDRFIQEIFKIIHLNL